VSERRCVVCGSVFAVSLRGRPRVYCSKRCRQQAYIGRQVLDAPSEIAHVESEQMLEAEHTGRTVWRYEADDEDEIRETAQVYRRFTSSPDLWANWED